MTNLYLKIIDELEKNRQVFIQKGMTPPRFIDIWDGQPYDENYEFVYPCIFFDYAANWTYAGKTKTGTATVELHVIADPLPDCSNVSKRLSEGLKRLDYYQIVADILEGINTENTTYLSLINESPVTTDYGIYHKLTFQTTVQRTYLNSDITGRIEDINIKQPKIYTI